MMARAEGYCGSPFRGQSDVTQEGTLSPTIFNVVVDIVVHHWVSVVAEAEGGDRTGGFRRGHTGSSDIILCQ